MSLPTIPEYSSCINNPMLIRPVVLNGGHPLTKGTRIMKYSGGFCVVFPFQTEKRKYAVRCWHAELPDAKTRCKHISQALRKTKLPYFAGFEYYEDGIVTPQGIQPLVVMDWIEAMPLKKYLAEHIYEPETLNQLASNFMEMVKALHGNHFSHGDLQHGNIMVKPDKSLMLVDYDSMYVPELEGMKDEVKGLVGYQHFSRWTNEYLTEKADYFSELVIYTSLRTLAKKPKLWYDLKMEDTETLLFSGDDLRMGNSAPIFKVLKKDSDLMPLADNLCKFISTPGLDNLVPLEEATLSIRDKIAEKWKIGNGYKPVNKKGKIVDPSEISKKWIQ